MNERKSLAPIDFKLSEAGEVSVAFSRLNVIDSDNDVTFPGALPVGKSVAMSDFGHTSWEGAKPVGKGTIREDGDLGIFDGKFFMSTTHGRDAYETVKEMGELQEWSYGYVVLDGPPGVFDGKSVRELRKLDVFEVSPVLKGAGIGTATLAIKSDAPGADVSLPDRLSWVQGEWADALDYATARYDMRANQGRKLSRSDRASLEDFEDALVAHLEEVRRLLVVPEDPKETAKRRTAIDVLLAQARLVGVPI